jgi:TolB-like protein
VDAFFIGTVVHSQPERSYMVTKAERNRRTQVTPVDGRYLSPGLPVPGVPDSQLLTSAASVSIVSRMVDAQTGSILWAGSMKDDGEDVTAAMRTITAGFVESLTPIWPGLRRPKK